MLWGASVARTLFPRDKGAAAHPCIAPHKLRRMVSLPNYQSTELYQRMPVATPLPGNNSSQSASSRSSAAHTSA